MKKYIGMAWPSDGLNDSEYWSYLSSNYELLIIRYPVSGSFKKELLIKEGKIKFVSQFLKNIKLDNLDALILCDFASSVLNGKKYILKSELFFKKKLNVPVLNIVTSSLNFINNHKNKISIVSPYKNNITNTFLELIKDKKIIDKIFNLNFKSEKEINSTKNIIDYKKFKNLNSDLLFIGGGISVRYYKKYLQKKIKNKIYSSPMLLVKDTIKKIK
ncbi:MAG: hypothetical protein CL564_04045 [Alphaproteobacteria bacterium]|nr:hypothetical protein [Alphaproteobacteria bacterium]